METNFFSLLANAIASPLLGGVFAVIATKLCDDWTVDIAAGGIDETVFMRTLHSFILSPQQTTSVIESNHSNEHR